MTPGGAAQPRERKEQVPLDQSALHKEYKERLQDVFSRNRTLWIGMVTVLLVMMLQQQLHLSPHKDQDKNTGAACEEQVEEWHVPKSECAWWIPPENRKVVFWGSEMKQWRDLYPEDSASTWSVNNDDFTFYWTASLDYALQQNGFEVSVVSGELSNEEEEELVSTTHRIIVPHANVWKAPLFEKMEGICKTRTLFWPGNWRARANVEQGWDVWNPQQVLTAYPENYNTFVGFFPHSLLWSDMEIPAEKEEKEDKDKKHAMILSNRACALKLHKDLLQRLMDEGFTLHTTACGNEEEDDDDCCSELWNKDEERFVRHGNQSLRQFVQEMRKMSFLLGIKGGGEEDTQFLSPLVLEGLARGVPFLNPFVNTEEDASAALRTYPLQPPVYRPLGDYQGPILQHDAVAMVGFPYVYNVHLEDPEEVVRAARNALAFEFISFVPWEFHPQSMVERVCDFLETNALCDCPNPVFGEKVMEKLKEKEGDEEKNEVDASIDCHASSYIRL